MRIQVPEMRRICQEIDALDKVLKRETACLQMVSDKLKKYSALDLQLQGIKEELEELRSLQHDCRMAADVLETVCGHYVNCENRIEARMEGALVVYPATRFSRTQFRLPSGMREILGS